MKHKSDNDGSLTVKARKETIKNEVRMLVIGLSYSRMIVYFYIHQHDEMCF